jgi:DUF2934 family protein
MADELRGGDNRRRRDENSSTVTSQAFAIDPDLLARRAYERYRNRGGEHGHDLQDWFEAERELIAAQLEET